MGGEELSYLDPPVERVTPVGQAPRIMRCRVNYRERLLGERDVPYKPDTIPRLKCRSNPLDYRRDGVLCLHHCLKQVVAL